MTKARRLRDERGRRHHRACPHDSSWHRRCRPHTWTQRQIHTFIASTPAVKIPMTAATDLRPAKLPTTKGQASWCAATKAMLATSARKGHPRYRQRQALDRPHQPKRARSRSRAALSRTIRIKRRHHQHAQPDRRPHRHHPLQEEQIIALAHLPQTRQRKRTTLPTARSAQRLAQGPLIGLWHLPNVSRARHASS